MTQSAHNRPITPTFSFPSFGRSFTFHFGMYSRILAAACAIPPTRTGYRLIMLQAGLIVDRGPVRPHIDVYNPTNACAMVEATHGTIRCPAKTTRTRLRDVVFRRVVQLSLQYSQWTAATVITVSPTRDMQR